MNTKITLEVKDSKAKIKYSPKVDKDSYVALLNNILNNLPNAILPLLTEVPILRPACQEEQDAHVYVFQEGKEGETENKLYNYRKNIYDTLVSIFSQILTTAFPDVEYIESCRVYQQTYCYDEDGDTESYKAKVDEVTKYVREHFKEILKNVYDEVEQNVS